MSTRQGVVLVTGGLGCIGAWTVRALLLTGREVVVLDPSSDTRRLDQVTSPEMRARVRLVLGDVTDLAGLEKVLVDQRVDAIVHLAALQLPFCRSDPPKGALVNVVGTVNLFEAASRAGIPRLVYTSSVAIFDQPGGRVSADANGRPASHYGVYKLANEGTARVYWSERGVSSLGVRPMTVYGPGRDQGLTSSPTRAMLAAALGCRYEIGFGGTTVFQYAGDVGHALAAAVDTSFEGAHVVNLNGSRASVADVVAGLLGLLGNAADGIVAGQNPIPFPDDVDTSGLDVLGPPPVTPLDEGIAATVEFFQLLRARGALIPEEHGLVIANGRAIDRELAPSTR